MIVRTILPVTLLLALGAAGLAVAQDAEPAPSTPQDEAGVEASAGLGWGPAFVDANGDGICDRYQAGGQGSRRGRRGRGRGRGRFRGR